MSASAAIDYLHGADRAPTTPRTQGTAMTSDLIEAIRAATAEGATAEQKALGARACTMILVALDAKPGNPIAFPGAPQPHPLAGITLDQALDLVIARLTTIAAKEPASGTSAPQPPRDHGPRIALVHPPAARKQR